MLPQLDEKYVVLFVKADQTIAKPAIKGIQTLDNTTSINVILDWYGRADTVMTSCFHDVHWTNLINETVVCLHYSSNF